MERVIAFVDGFNMYHSLIENNCSHLKWINYKSLAEAFILQDRERLVKVFYFSALTPWNADKKIRHQTYIRALESQNVEIVLGKFKSVTRTCRADCQKTYCTFEEKETDINIAVTMLLEAANDSFDKALLFSGDSDMIAAVKALKKLAPHKHIRAVIPYARSSIDLANNCHSSTKIKYAQLVRNQFPPSIEIAPGNFLNKPDTW